MATTRVLDTVYTARGTLFAGTLTISWPPMFVSSKTIAAGSYTYTVVAGVVDINLEPNDVAVPAGTSYTVVYTSTDEIHTEYWLVPTSGSTVLISTIRTAVVPTPVLNFNYPRIAGIPVAALLKGGSTGIATSIPIGTAGQVLTVVSGQPAWAAATGGGSGTITTLNTLTGAVQTFAVASTGTDFTIVSSGTVHTFAIPSASATARGLITTAAQTIAGAKTFTSAIIAALTGNVSGNLTGNVNGDVTGNLTGNVTGNVTGTVSGNAGTVTNGVYTTGSYGDPAWITSLAASKLTGSIADARVAQSNITQHQGALALAASQITSGTIATARLGTGTADSTTFLRGDGSWAPGAGGGGSGISSLNALTPVTQVFAVGSSGTDFGISSSVSTHTFNLPDASATARGVISTGAQTLAGAKTLTGKLSLVVPTASLASLVLPSGVSPTTPVAGEIFNVSGDIRFHNGTTVKQVMMATLVTAAGGQIVLGNPAGDTGASYLEINSGDAASNAEPGYIKLWSSHATKRKAHLYPAGDADGRLAISASTPAADTTDYVVTRDSTDTLTNKTIGAAQISATGTRSTTTFLRGDNSWQVPAGGGGGTTTLYPLRTKRGPAASSPASSTQIDSYSIPAATLAVDDIVIIRARFTKTGTADAARYQIDFGGTAIVPETSSGAGDILADIEAHVYVIGATSQIGHGFITRDNGVSLGTTSGAPTAAISGAITVSIKANFNLSTSDTIRLEWFSVTVMKAANVT